MLHKSAYDSELFGPTGREFPAELSLSRPDWAIIDAHLAATETLTTQIEMLDEKIDERVLESPAALLLLTIPSGEQTIAAVIVAELGDVDRFDTDKEAVSYEQLDPVVH